MVDKKEASPETVADIPENPAPNTPNPSTRVDGEDFHAEELDKDSTDNVIPRFSAAQSGFGEFLGSAVQFTSMYFGAMLNIIKGDFSLVLSPWAAYAIRVVALVVAVFAVFDPFITTASSGFLGWVQDSVVNLVFALGLFVIAEVVLVQRDISETLKSISNQKPTEDTTHE
jgi:hypothetical protein